MFQSYLNKGKILSIGIIQQMTDLCGYSVFILQFLWLQYSPQKKLPFHLESNHGEMVYLLDNTRAREATSFAWMELSTLTSPINV